MSKPLRNRFLSPKKTGSKSRSRSPNKKEEKEVPNNVLNSYRQRKPVSIENRKNQNCFQAKQVVNYMKRYLFHNYLPVKSEVVDWCCGQGGDLNKFAHQKISGYIGVDFCPEALEEAAYRARTNSRFQKCTKNTKFLQVALRTNAIRIDPPVDIASCQLSLHYLWPHADIFLTSVKNSLKFGGLFLITIVDSDRIPKEGILGHPYLKVTPPVLRDDGYQYYKFTFPGLIEGVEEAVIPQKELIDKCAELKLKFVTSFSAKEIWSDIEKFSLNPLKLNQFDFQAVDLYRCFVFSKQIA